MDQTPDDATDLIERLRGGDRQALAALFDHYRERLRRMVDLRIDNRVRARLDAYDRWAKVIAKRHERLSLPVIVPREEQEGATHSQVAA